MLKIISDVPVLDMNLGKKIDKKRTKQSSKFVYIFWHFRVQISNTFSSFLARKSNFEKYQKLYFGFFMHEIKEWDFLFSF